MDGAKLLLLHATGLAFVPDDSVSSDTSLRNKSLFHNFPGQLDVSLIL